MTRKKKRNEGGKDVKCTHHNFNVRFEEGTDAIAGLAGPDNQSYTVLLQLLEKQGAFQLPGARS